MRFHVHKFNFHINYSHCKVIWNSIFPVMHEHVHKPCAALYFTCYARACIHRPCAALYFPCYARACKQTMCSALFYLLCTSMYSLYTDHVQRFIFFVMHEHVHRPCAALYFLCYARACTQTMCSALFSLLCTSMYTDHVQRFILNALAISLIMRSIISPVNETY